MRKVTSTTPWKQKMQVLFGVTSLVTLPALPFPGLRTPFMILLALLGTLTALSYVWDKTRLLK